MGVFTLDRDGLEFGHLGTMVLSKTLAYIMLGRTGLNAENELVSHAFVDPLAAPLLNYAVRSVAFASDRRAHGGGELWTAALSGVF